MAGLVIDEENKMQNLQKRGIHRETRISCTRFQDPLVQKKLEYGISRACVNYVETSKYVADRVEFLSNSRAHYERGLPQF